MWVGGGWWKFSKTESFFYQIPYQGTFFTSKFNWLSEYLDGLDIEAKTHGGIISFRKCCYYKATLTFI